MAAATSSSWVRAPRRGRSLVSLETTAPPTTAASPEFLAAPVLAPEAPSPEARAGRRADQIGADVAVVLAEQAIRDQRDVERAQSPLRPADDAITIDTSDLTLDETVERVVALVRAVVA